VNMTDPALSEIEEKLASRTYPRVTKESIEARIKEVNYLYIGTGEAAKGTICIITMENGWTSTGFSAPADPRNYDEDIGRHYAYENAFKPLWQLEGYLLRERLHKE